MISTSRIKESSLHFKLFVLLSGSESLKGCIRDLTNLGITPLNIGREASIFLDSKKDYAIDTIELVSFIRNLMNNSKDSIDDYGGSILAVYNFGVLFEPQLQLNIALLFKEFSKLSTLIIVWEGQFLNTGRLFFLSETSKYHLELPEAQLISIYS